MASKQGNWSLWLNSADRVLYTRLVQRVIRGCIPIQQRSSATCGYSSVGRAFDLGSNSRGFDSRYPRNLSRCVTGKDRKSVVRIHMRMFYIHKRRERAAPNLPGIRRLWQLTNGLRMQTRSCQYQLTAKGAWCLMGARRL
jgi:hypothetical protein